MMAELGDVITEFKNAKPPEKALIVGSVIAVAGIAFYVYKKQNSGTSTSTTGTSTPSSTGTSNSSGIPTIDTSGGQVPLLPSNVNPIYDANGNIVGYQQAPTTPPVTTTPVTTPTAPTTPTPPVSTPKLPVTTTPTAKPFVYTVSSGNNLSEIGQKYGVSWQSIYSANKSVIGSNPNLIRPGQKLVIPGKTGGGATTGNHANPRNLQMIARQQSVAARAYAMRGGRS